MIKTRRAMKRIQPFTIGTKLSVPSETKCPEYVGIIPPVPALDCCELRNDSINTIPPFHEDTAAQRLSTSHQSAPVDGLSEDIKEDVMEEERDSASPPASSRSIRKIAMCANAEAQKNCHATNFKMTNSETNITNSPTEKLLHVEERLSDGSGSQLETEPWARGKKIKNLQYDYSMPAFPHDEPEDASHSQRRDLKDLENSLIQLTTSLDLTQEEPESPLQMKTDAVDLGREMLRRRQSPGDHIDKSWLKLRSLLRGYHQDLMLALDVSSFYQQADSIISAINCKRNSLLLDIQKNNQDKETREIACQINMLNDSASRLSNLHPTLARRVACKQAEVKENWANLQEFLRNPKTDASSKRLSSLPTDPQTTCPESQSVARNEGHGVMGKDVKEEQNRLRGFECSQGLWAQRMWAPVEECSPSDTSCSKLDNVSGKQDMDWTSCVGQMDHTTLIPSQECLMPSKLSKDMTSSTGMTPSWLKDNTNLAVREEQDCSKQSQDHSSSKIEELLSQVEVLWDALQKKYGDHDETEQAEKELYLTRDKTAQILPLSNHLPEYVEEGGSGMLAKFLELLDPCGHHKMSQQDVPGAQDSTELTKAVEMALDRLSDQTDRERPPKDDQTTEELQSSLSTLTLRINQHLSRCAELSMDLLDIETDMAVLCDAELSGLEGLQEQQDDLEANYHIIEGEVKEMETLASLLEVPPPEQRDLLREEVQAILQAWEEVGRNMAENRCRLEKFHQIQDYFENYLAMITWTENTRSCILAGGGAWKESEVAEIDRSIETKLDEFNKLAADGQTLMQEESQFKDIIKERTDELQSMLGWIQVNWHAQREQLKGDQNERPEEAKNPVQKEVVPPEKLSSDSLSIINSEIREGAMETQPSQNNSEQQRHDVSSVVSQESCLSKTSLGSSICLILSFDEQSSGINQVTKQWSPNNNEFQCIKNDITVADQKKEQIEDSTSNIHVNRHQSPDSQSETLQQDVLAISKETKHHVGSKSPCGNLAELQKSLNNNQRQPVQSPSKEQASSHLSPCNIQPSYCNLPAERLQSQGSNQTQLHPSPNSDQMQKPELSVMHQTQNQQPPSYNQELTQQSPHSDLETNQEPSESKNQSNDQPHREPAAEVTHRVFTYLHVSDSSKSTERVLEPVSPPHVTDEDTVFPALCSSSVSLSSTHSSSSLSHNVDGGAVCKHNRFKASSVFRLKEPIRNKEGKQRRNSTLGIVGLESSGKPSNIFRQRCNTWPEGKKGGKGSQSNSKLHVFIKKSMLPTDSVIGDKFNPVTFPGDNLPIKTPGGPLKNICSYLSLGSTLSFSLPKGFSNMFHNNIPDSENKKESEPALIYDDSSNSSHQPLHSTQSPTVMSTFNQKSQPAMEVEPMIHTKQTEMDPVTVCEELNMENLIAVEEPTTEVEDVQQYHSINENTEPVLMQERVPTWAEGPDTQKPALVGINDSFSQPKTSPPMVNGSPTADQCSLCPSSPPCGHKCFSVHTKIKDLDGHLYYASKYMKISSPANSRTSIVLGLSNGLGGSGSRKNGRVINCGERDCAVCFRDTVKETEAVRVICAGEAVQGTEGLLQPDHWLFQQEEEELEDIWRGRVGNITANCTMETNKDEETGLSIKTNVGHVTHPLHG